jgi:hypothetical protein
MPLPRFRCPTGHPTGSRPGTGRRESRLRPPSSGSSAR